MRDWIVWIITAIFIAGLGYGIFYFVYLEPLAVRTLNGAQASSIVTRNLQAFIAGSFLAIGWLMTFLLGQVSDALQRVRRRRDLQATFRVEIEDYRRALRPFAENFNSLDRDDTIQATMAKFSRNGKKRPFVPRLSAPVMFEALRQDVVLLPPEPLKKVVWFYSQLSDAGSLADDLIAYAEDEPDPETFSKAFWDYLAMRALAWELAGQAILDLDTSLAKGLWWRRMLGITPDGTAQ